jgi:hypothetical protein
MKRLIQIQVDGPTKGDFMKKLLGTIAFGLLVIPAFAQQSQYLGKLSANHYDGESVSNPYGTHGSAYSPTSINNPYGQYGDPYSPLSVTNPYALNAPRLYASDGTYLGRLSANRYDPESVSNPYGAHGNPYSPTSINNQFSPYGNRYSPLSPRNPHTTQGPRIIGGYGRR